MRLNERVLRKTENYAGATLGRPMICRGHRLLTCAILRAFLLARGNMAIPMVELMIMQKWLIHRGNFNVGAPRAGCTRS